MSVPNGTYTLTQVNGKAAPEGIHAVISGNGPVNFSCKVANSMNGSLNYTNGELKGMLISTMMMGPPEHMEVERIYSQGFHEGMRVTQDGDKLTMSHGNDTLQFTK